MAKVFVKVEGSRRSRAANTAKMNTHIDFKREGEKTNSRKDWTVVTCIKCKSKVKLPFKPRKPEVYCDACFKKKSKKTSLD